MILCDISAEFYLNFKFIIIKIIMYSNCSITSFKHLWFISKIFCSFWWNGNGNKRHSQWNFHKIKVKDKSKRKRNLIIYHFLVKSKSHERVHLLITTRVNIYQTKKSSRKWKDAFLKENWWSNLETPLFLRGPPLSTNTLILGNFFMTLLFVQISKTILGGRNYEFFVNNH